MSHSVCLVIGDDPETLLAPFSENIDLEPYRKYETGGITDFWAYKILMEKELIQEGCTWGELCAAYNVRYGGENFMYFDDELDRMYELSTYNTKSKWDWYQLGGRWSDYFLTFPTANRPSRRVDQARKSTIDWATMRQSAKDEAYAQYAEVMSVLTPHLPMLPWSHFLTKHSVALEPNNIDVARKEYHAQSGKQALFAANIHVFGDPVTEFYLNEPNGADIYAEQIAVSQTTPFAILTSDGEWHEKGGMGWFGMVANEQESDVWTPKVRELITAAPDDALFSIYDLHI
jgi:hypothetical protein